MRSTLSQILRVALLPVLLLAVAWPAVAGPDSQTEPKPAAEFGGMVEVSEVLLDVLVTDRDGQVVLGLGPEDFVVHEKGKAEPRSITGASFYSNRFQVRVGVEGVQKPLPNEVLADRYFILFFHNPLVDGPLASPLTRRIFDAGRDARRWVHEQMLPGDWVAVVSYDFKLKVQQDFTNNSEALEAAIDNAMTRKDPSKVWATRQRPPAPEGQPSLLAHLPEGKALREASTRPYDALRLVADATEGIVGRKNLVLFSLGFGEIQEGLPMTKADERFYPETLRALNDHNVAVYTVDIKPLGSDTTQYYFLNELASDTGGTYNGTFVNFITPLKEIADENNGYYLLSYQAEHPAGDEGYREVEVDTVNPAFKVRSRRGYRYGS